MLQKLMKKNPREVSRHIASPPSKQSDQGTSILNFRF
ncbi:hypothetical protein E2C01_045110 [Portunus trituberculatus]|uniref:Uncharacterized protein n=1 Tax=Portunus trituberculatus TaxID=210409 RepID=A0A5B7G0D4_PORTR|nr:hypothetical protein [Portunus trituberculatus]